MKKKAVHIVPVILCISLFLSSCGAKAKTGAWDTQNAEAYVKAVLDASYKGEFKQYMEITNSTEENAAALYNAGIDNAITSSGLSESDISDELIQKLRQMYAEIYKKAKYVVSGSEETEENGFNVIVTIQPFAIFDTLEEDLTAVLTENQDAVLNLTTDAEMNEYIYEKLYDLMMEKLDNISYKQPQEIQVKITQENNVYSASQEDLLKVENALFSITE